MFLGPVELANGYVELADSAELAARIGRDNETRRQRGRPVRPVDTGLLAALDAGLPDCAGVAMGIERFVALYEACGGEAPASSADVYIAALGSGTLERAFAQ